MLSLYIYEVSWEKNWMLFRYKNKDEPQTSHCVCTEITFMCVSLHKCQISAVMAKLDGLVLGCYWIFNQRIN